MMLHGKRIANASLKEECLVGEFGYDVNTMSLEEAESRYNKLISATYDEKSVEVRILATFAKMARSITGYISAHKRLGKTVDWISSEKMNEWFLQSNCNCFSSSQRQIVDGSTLIIRPKHEAEQETVIKFTSEIAACLIVMARNSEDCTNAYKYIGEWLDQTLLGL